MEQANYFSCYTHSEGRTGGGQFVEFTCRPEEVDQVKEFLKKIRTIDIPTTGRIVVSNDYFRKISRYEIIQHNYAGGGCGYTEVLEIKNPPDGRWGIVINEYWNGELGSVFTEWETLENACDVFRKNWGLSEERISTLAGFKRRVICNALTPWFYAIGDEELVGDYAFPYGLQDDPVYRFGRKFVFSPYGGIPEIKTCMGARFFTEDGSDGQGRPFKHRKRFVYWSDGSVWIDEPIGYGCPPRPLEEGEKWTVEVVKKFRELLSGMKDKFSIKFITGDIFTGVIKSSCKTSPEGRYDLKVTLKGGEFLEGYVDFKPTPDIPDIISKVFKVYKKSNKEVESVEVVSINKKRAGKKWAGVYYSR